MSNQKIWMNIDHPLKTCTIHGDPLCPYVQKMAETKYKGIEELKRDGGWLSFKNIREAKEFHLTKYDRYKWKEHCYFSSKIYADQKGERLRDRAVQHDFPAFNDVTDHYQKIMGLPTRRINYGHLPRWLRFFYALVMAVVVIGAIMMIVALFI